MRSENSARDATRSTSGRYRSWIAAQSRPERSSVQNWSRCSLQASRNICRHSAPGSTSTRKRSRSIQPLSRPGSSFEERSFAVATGASARSRLPARTRTALPCSETSAHVTPVETETTLSSAKS